MTHTRLLPLEGGCNFRDCGGYPAAAGRHVRWGRLYRSGVMSRLTASDITAMSQRDVRVICDLRRTDERAYHPNPDFGVGVKTLAWDTGTETSPLRDANFAGSVDAQEARAAMHRMYARLPFVLQPRLTGVFKGLLECADAGSIVVHCSAGKDRTGMAMALVLTALGVHRDAVVADYELTNSAVDLRGQLLGRDSTGAGLAATAAPIRGLNEVALAAVLAASPDYIVAGLEAIEARHGSVTAYLTAELSVDTAAIAHLQAAYLDA